MTHILRYLFMQRAIIIILVLLTNYSNIAEAQTGHNKRTIHQHAMINRTELIAKSFAQKLDSLYFIDNNKQASADAMTAPYYISIIGVPAPYESTLRRLFNLSDNEQSTYSVTNSILDAISRTDLYMTEACIKFPKLTTKIPQTKSENSDQEAPSITPELTLSERFIPNEKEQTTPPRPLTEDELGIIVHKPNFWNFKTNFALQFTQNYVSDNWYKGGESHNALLASTIIEANYNNQRKITFDNKLEMKLGFQTSHNDKEHKYKTNSDLLRLTNKLGLRAVKHWYYTVMLQSWTQFYKGYKSNDPKVYSDFMSPFESLLSVGMDFQTQSKNNRFKINATLSPIALKLKYVDRKPLRESFGLKKAQSAKWEYGSNITINYTWNIIKNVSWTGRIYYFTDYSSTQLEWENTFNLSINRYLSARIFLYPRYDDSRTRKDGQSDFEFNELLSLGLNLNF